MGWTESGLGLFPQAAPPAAKPVYNPGVYTQVTQNVFGAISSRTPMTFKADDLLAKLVRELPMTLIARIECVAIVCDDKGYPKHIDVRTTPGGSVRFTNLNTFPTDADIARLAMELP
jgi:hypothetical protein